MPRIIVNIDWPQRDLNKRKRNGDTHVVVRDLRTLVTSGNEDRCRHIAEVKGEGTLFPIENLKGTQSGN